MDSDDNTSGDDAEEFMVGLNALTTQVQAAVSFMLLDSDEEQVADPRADSRLSVRFDLDQFSLDATIRLFRFNALQIRDIYTQMQMPLRFNLGNHMSIGREEGICIALRRLAFPNRLYELEREFNRSESVLSRIINTVLLWVYHKYKALLEYHPSLDAQAIVAYSDAITTTWPTVERIYAFIDGTKQLHARPLINQRILFSGHKRVHCLSWQAVITPNGLISCLFGPLAGSVNDRSLLNQSGLLPRLAQIDRINGKQYALYGDAGYYAREQLSVPFSKPTSWAQKEFNRSMSVLRVSVEHGFAIVHRLFAYVCYKQQMKVGLQPTAAYFAAAVLFTNIHCSFNHNQVSIFFGLQPLTLQEYLS